MLKIVINQKHTANLGDLFPEFFANLNPAKVQAGASIGVVKRQACQKGKHNANKLQNSKKWICSVCTLKGSMKNGSFQTFEEQNQTKSEINKRIENAKRTASSLISNARCCDLEGVKTNFDGIFKSATEKELNKKLNGDETGALFMKLIVSNKVKINYPQATEEEMIALQNHKPLPEFSLLQ